MIWRLTFIKNGTDQSRFVHTESGSSRRLLGYTSPRRRPNAASAYTTRSAGEGDQRDGIGEAERVYAESVTRIISRGYSKQELNMEAVVSKMALHKFGVWIL